jgi:transcriptional regulator with XRE-family HTH domain
MTSDFTQWIGTELEKRNWTHARLAQEAGVSRPIVTQVISGKVPPSCEFCIKVAIALDVSPENILRMADILPGEQTEIGDSPIAQEIAAIAASLPLEQRKELLNFAHYLATKKPE